MNAQGAQLLLEEMLKASASEFEGGGQALSRRGQATKEGKKISKQSAVGLCCGYGHETERV